MVPVVQLKELQYFLSYTKLTTSLFPLRSEFKIYMSICKYKLKDDLQI